MPTRELNMNRIMKTLLIKSLKAYEGIYKLFLKNLILPMMGLIAATTTAMTFILRYIWVKNLLVCVHTRSTCICLWESYYWKQIYWISSLPLWHFLLWLCWLPWGPSRSRWPRPWPRTGYFKLLLERV